MVKITFHKLKVLAFVFCYLLTLIDFIWFLIYETLIILLICKFYVSFNFLQLKPSNFIYKVTTYRFCSVK